MRLFLNNLNNWSLKPPERNNRMANLIIYDPLFREVR